MSEHLSWYRTLPVKREGRTDYVVGIYNDSNRESEGTASVYGNTAEQAEATACLLCAAPDLLAALQGILGEIHDSPLRFEDALSCHQIRELARAAIAKAES